jgi:hypothetical protein
VCVCVCVRERERERERESFIRNYSITGGPGGRSHTGSAQRSALRYVTSMGHMVLDLFSSINRSLFLHDEAGWRLFIFPEF